jgi:hypothetical protein
LKITLKQAAGNLPRKESLSIYNSLANPAASCGECARYCGPNCQRYPKVKKMLKIIE